MITDEEKLLTKIMESRSKINVLADESTHVSDKLSLIVFFRVNIDSKARLNFQLDLVRLESLCAARIADKMVDYLLKNYYRNAPRNIH